MMRCKPPWAILALAVFAATAVHAQDGHRGGGGRGAGGGSGRAAQGYAAPRGYAAPHGYAAPQAYAPPAYGARSARGGYYAPPPSSYEPPPYAYRGPNSLGAQWGEQQDQARMGVRQGRIVSLSRVVETLERLRPGRVLDAGLETAADGRMTYRVRWAATGGRRIDFIVDAETGAVIGRGNE